MKRRVVSIEVRPTNFAPEIDTKIEQALLELVAQFDGPRLPPLPPAPRLMVLR